MYCTVECILWLGTHPRKRQELDPSKISHYIVLPHWKYKPGIIDSSNILLIAANMVTDTQSNILSLLYPSSMRQDLPRSIILDINTKDL